MKTATGKSPGRSAFTLLELLVAVALSAILATVAAVSFAGAHRAARARDVADQVARYDRLAREASRNSGRDGLIAFDLDRGTISRGAAADESTDGKPPTGTGDRGEPPAALHLPAGFRIARLVSAPATATAGRVWLPCSARGQTPSYALAIAGPVGDQTWLVVAGLTGKVRQATDANEVEDIFRALSGGSPDGAPPPPPGGARDDAR